MKIRKYIFYRINKLNMMYCIGLGGLQSTQLEKEPHFECQGDLVSRQGLGFRVEEWRRRSK